MLFQYADTDDNGIIDENEITLFHQAVSGGDFDISGKDYKNFLKSKDFKTFKKAKNAEENIDADILSSFINELDILSEDVANCETINDEIHIYYSDNRKEIYSLDGHKTQEIKTDENNRTVTVMFNNDETPAEMKMVKGSTEENYVFKENNPVLISRTENKGIPALETVTNFQYDESGNRTEICKKPDGTITAVQYLPDGKPQSILTETDGRQISKRTFSYNQPMPGYLSVTGKSAAQNQACVIIEETTQDGTAQITVNNVDENGNYGTDDFISRKTGDIIILKREGELYTEEGDENDLCVTTYDGDDISLYDKGELFKKEQTVIKNGVTYEMKYKDGYSVLYIQLNENAKTLARIAQSVNPEKSLEDLEADILNKNRHHTGKDGLPYFEAAQKVLIPGEIPADDEKIVRRASPSEVTKEYSDKRFNNKYGDFLKNKDIDLISAEVTAGKDYATLWDFAEAFLKQQGVENPSNEEINDTVLYMETMYPKTKTIHSGDKFKIPIKRVHKNRDAQKALFEATSISWYGADDRFIELYEQYSNPETRKTMSEFLKYFYDISIGYSSRDNNDFNEKITQLKKEIDGYDEPDNRNRITNRMSSKKDFVSFYEESTGVKFDSKKIEEFLKIRETFLKKEKAIERYRFIAEDVDSAINRYDYAKALVEQPTCAAVHTKSAGAYMAFGSACSNLYDVFAPILKTSSQEEFEKMLRSKDDPVKFLKGIAQQQKEFAYKNLRNSLSQKEWNSIQPDDKTYNINMKNLKTIDDSWNEYYNDHRKDVLGTSDLMQKMDSSRNSTLKESHFYHCAAITAPKERHEQYVNPETQEVMSDFLQYLNEITETYERRLDTKKMTGWTGDVADWVMGGLYSFTGYSGFRNGDYYEKKVEPLKIMLGRRKNLDNFDNSSNGINKDSDFISAYEKLTGVEFDSNKIKDFLETRETYLKKETAIERYNYIANHVEGAFRAISNSQAELDLGPFAYHTGVDHQQIIRSAPSRLFDTCGPLLGISDKTKWDEMLKGLKERNIDPVEFLRNVAQNAKMTAYNELKNTLDKNEWAELKPDDKTHSVNISQLKKTNDKLTQNYNKHRKEVLGNSDLMNEIDRYSSNLQIGSGVVSGVAQTLLYAVFMAITGGGGGLVASEIMSGLGFAVSYLTVDISDRATNGIDNNIDLFSKEAFMDLADNAAIEFVAGCVFDGAFKKYVTGRAESRAIENKNFADINRTVGKDDMAAFAKSGNKESLITHLKDLGESDLAAFIEKADEKTLIRLYAKVGEGTMDKSGIRWTLSEINSFLRFHGIAGAIGGVKDGTKESFKESLSGHLAASYIENAAIAGFVTNALFIRFKNSSFAKNRKILGKFTERVGKTSEKQSYKNSDMLNDLEKQDREYLNNLFKDVRNEMATAIRAKLESKGYDTSDIEKLINAPEKLGEMLMDAYILYVLSEEAARIDVTDKDM